MEPWHQNAKLLSLSHSNPLLLEGMLPRLHQTGELDTEHGNDIKLVPEISS
jgi:hypothetical protein